HPGTDADDIADLLEYALGGNPAVNDRSILPSATIQTLNVDGLPNRYPTFSFRRMLGAEDIAYQVLWSASLSGAWEANGVLVSSTENGDGSATEVWRASSPVGAGSYFGRLQVTKP
ncbi:MAG: hypothetical protein V4710_16745, partial [Verrucomicrobiota bacterium]